MASNFSINENKIVQITPSSSSTTTSTIGATDGTWKTNISRIIGNGLLNGDAANNFLSIFSDSSSSLVSSLTSSLSVDSKVELVMNNNDSPKVGSYNGEPDKPIQDLLGGLSKISFKGISLGTVASALGSGLEAISTIKDSLSGASDSSTSDVFNPWFINIPAWNTSASGFEFSYTFNFAMGQYGLWNAKKEVVLPVLNLIAPSFPQQIANYTMKGPYPSAMELFTEVIIGAISSISGTNWSKLNFEDIGNGLAALLLEQYNKFTYNVKFGNMMTFRHCLVKDAYCIFNNETDTDGYPTSGSATVTFYSIIPPALTAKTWDSYDLRSVRFGV